MLARDPGERLGSRGKDEIRRHPFFLEIDWTALYRKQVPPPYNPCRHQKLEDAKNFEKEFTSLPFGSLDKASERDSEDFLYGAHDGRGLPVTSSPVGVSGTGEEEKSKELFVGFTYQGDSSMVDPTPL